MQQQLHIPNGYENCPTATHTYEISGKKYIVVSHYVGNKNINNVIHELAIRQAYAELKISA